MEFEEFERRYERWLTATQDLSEHTVRAYVADVGSLKQFLGHDFALVELKHSDLIGFVEHLTLLGRSSATIKRRLSGVRSFAGWLVHAEVLPASPAVDLGVRFSRPRRLPRAISRTDLRLLITYLSATAGLGVGPVGPFVGSARRVEATTLIAVLLMVGTGMRVGELTQVRPSDVDLPSRTIRVMGKGLRERMVYLSNDAIVGLVGSYLEAHQVGEGPATVLVNRSGRALTPGALRARLGRAGVESGMSVALTPHMLRHTAATQLIEAGVDIRFVQRLLGHASLTTTEIYTHVADRSLRHAVVEADVLGGFLTAR